MNPWEGEEAFRGEFGSGFWISGREMRVLGPMEKSCCARDLNWRVLLSGIDWSGTTAARSTAVRSKSASLGLVLSIDKSPDEGVSAIFTSFSNFWGETELLHTGREMLAWQFWGECLGMSEARRWDNGQIKTEACQTNQDNAGIRYQ